MPQTQHPAIQYFLDYIRFEKRYSSHTVISYTNDLEGFFRYMATQYEVADPAAVQSAFVRSWLAYLREQGMGAVTLNRKISTLKSFFKYLLKTGRVLQSPMGQVISPKKGRKLPVFVKEEEAVELVKGLNSHPEDWKSLNTAMLVSIFYATGMRLSELIGLRESQVDEGRSQIKVLGKGNKERIIPVSQELIRLVSTYKELKRKEFGDCGDILLVTGKGKRMYPRYAWDLVNRSLSEASTLSKRSPHVLRHSFATHLMNNGADLNAVKELLGHSSLAATQVYTHNTIEKLKDIHKKAHPKG